MASPSDLVQSEETEDLHDLCIRMMQESIKADKERVAKWFEGEPARNAAEQELERKYQESRKRKAVADAEAEKRLNLGIEAWMVFDDDSDLLLLSEPPSTQTPSSSCQFTVPSGSECASSHVFGFGTIKK